MSFPERPILKKQELDAFIIAALTLESSEPNTLQELNVSSIISTLVN